jgi:hypothetical protein
VNELTIGEITSHYNILGGFDEGGMGVVYQVRGRRGKQLSYRYARGTAQ